MKGGDDARPVPWPPGIEQGAPLNIAGRIEEATAAVALAGTTVTLTLSREEIGDPERITFLMWAVREEVSDRGSTGGDAFPDSPQGGPYTQAAWTFPEE